MYNWMTNFLFQNFFVHLKFCLVLNDSVLSYCRLLCNLRKLTSIFFFSADKFKGLLTWWAGVFQGPLSRHKALQNHLKSITIFSIKSPFYDCHTLNPITYQKYTGQNRHHAWQNWQMLACFPPFFLGT